MIKNLPISSKMSRLGFIRSLLRGLKKIPQLSHPTDFSGVRSRYTHTRNMCSAASLLNKSFTDPQPLWPYIAVYIACHDIGHTPYGHAGERVVKQLYLDGFSNSSQSERFMFIDNKEWPSHVKPLGFYESTPVTRPSVEEEKIVQLIVNFFDDLENAIGDANDLELMGQSRAKDFLKHNCSWSLAIDLEAVITAPHGMFNIIENEFQPSCFRSLFESLCDRSNKALVSINELRKIIDEERTHCSYAQNMDAKAEREIPEVYEYICKNLAQKYGKSCDESFIKMIAIDVLSSAGTIEEFAVCE